MRSYEYVFIISRYLKNVFFGAILKNRRVLREQVDFFLGVGNDDGFYRQALCPVDQNSGMEHH